jgi:RND family efflux transporter MFP subunit
VVAVTGTITPAPGGDLVVSAPEAARIAEMPKGEGDAVKEGDLLVRFDIPSLPADVASKRADVTQATAKVDAAKAAVARVQILVTKGVAAQRELEEARTAQAEAEAALAQANSAVGAATSLAGRTVVRAPFSGIIAKRFHNPGDIVEPGAADPILRVINPKSLQVVAAVPLAELAHVMPGKTASIIGPGSEEGDPGKVLTRPAQVDPGSATADVRVSFNEPTTLPAGTVVRIEIQAEGRKEALVIPSAAVVHDGEETFVMVAGADNKAHKHAVKTGLASEEMIEITSGLAAGDQVIVQGQNGLPDGAAVTVQK